MEHAVVTDRPDPTDEQFTQSGHLGFGAFDDTIQALAQMYAQCDGDPRLFAASLGGGLVAIGDALRKLHEGTETHKVEQLALAHLRGAIRGSGKAVTDSGQPFMRPCDA